MASTPEQGEGDVEGVVKEDADMQPGETQKDSDVSVGPAQREDDEDGQGGEGFVESEADGSGAADVVPSRPAFAVTVVPRANGRERSRRRAGKENRAAEANATSAACS